MNKFAAILISVLVPVFIYWLCGGDFNRSPGLGITFAFSLIAGSIAYWDCKND